MPYIIYIYTHTYSNCNLQTFTIKYYLSCHRNNHKAYKMPVRYYSFFILCLHYTVAGSSIQPTKTFFSVVKMNTIMAHDCSMFVFLSLLTETPYSTCKYFFRMTPTERIHEKLDGFILTKNLGLNVQSGSVVFLSLDCGVQ